MKPKFYLPGCPASAPSQTKWVHFIEKPGKNGWTQVLGTVQVIRGIG